MRWCSAVSEAHDADQAITEIAQAVHAGLQGAPADLVVLFVTGQLSHEYKAIPEAARRSFGQAVVLGSSAAGVQSSARRAGSGCVITALAASLPGVKLHAFHLDAGGLPPWDAPAERWQKLVGVPPEVGPHFLLMPDPFTCDVEHLLRGLDLAYPAATKVGGNASGGTYPGSHALFCGGEVHQVGVVGLAMWGDIAVDAVVAQGCRPIGQPMLVTSCHGTIVRELNSEPPVQVLRNLYASLSARDRALFRSSLFVGIEMNADQEIYQAGDFLVRNITGMDPEDGAISIGAVPEAWQVMQFHVRDAQSAADDLRARLTRYLATPQTTRPVAALQFSCLGRGMHMYDQPDIDALLLREHLPALPLSGFFCNGEIGPVAGRSFLHGYTTVFALFRPANDPVA